MSTITDAVNVAGSIGGLASAIGDATTLITGDWFKRLDKASYGNLQFGVESIRTAAGRKTSIHTYPFRDDVWVEDLGKRPRQFEVLGFLVEGDLITGGGDVISQRKALLSICETAGGQTLVHPTLGTVQNVCCLGVETIERRDLGRAFEFRLTLIVSGNRLFPTAIVSTGAANAQNANLTGIAALADFVKTTATSIAAGAAVVQQAVSTAVGWYQIGVTAINDVKRIIGAVSTLAGNFGRLFGGGNSGISGSNQQASTNTTAADLLSASSAARTSVLAEGVALQAAAQNPSDSATLGEAAQAYVAAVAAAATAPADAVRLVSTLAQYSPSAVVPAGQIGAAMGTMQTAMAALLRRYALAQLATTLTTYQPSSQEDADSVLGAAVELIDAESDVAGDAGDDDSYVALRALRQAVVADLQARGANLVSIATFTFNASLPSLVLANRIYRDPTREQQLVQQVAPIHPAFMPTTFKALSN
ncbi:prophage DNA circulation protein [Paraburkholderia bannensis]|uniref:Prophage DNA circulation protein n=1 Tax=Paraburkholderia bannensis TaxID=765414 RepID=A0A7W9TW88_9BURK|nr:MULTISPECIES: DNA circularization N-terminal domain-containing protein [Paraburkholderia]MBB3256859.1 prophage DNA circulation protein [Paraburkholderia sp. WP4_3_2]MBB6101856.1 prophage DNA circulation protein [Paraburkholderia bannensis]